MCTVSLISTGPEPGGLRIVFSRDERRTRALGDPPMESSIGDRRVLMPRDPAGGGTWVAVNDAGIALMLLNKSDGRASRRQASAHPERRSRGQIILSLIHHGSIDAIVQQAMKIRAADFEPFRLIISSIGGSIELASDGLAVRCRGAVLPGRIAMFTSSGIGDHLVETPRRQLFEAMLGDGRHDSDTQDAFHRYQWTDRPHLSVRMSREDARTVSMTTIELRRDLILMRYAALDDRGAEMDRAIHVLPTGSGDHSNNEIVEGALA